MSVHPLISPTADPVRRGQGPPRRRAPPRGAARARRRHRQPFHGHRARATTDRYLILPFGLHWSEARASDMIVFDESGATLEGDGVVELSAQCIHAPIHRICGARVVLHTHQTWALALNMLKDNRLLPASQTAAFFHGHVAYDDTYMGTADFLEEGERLARADGRQARRVHEEPRRAGRPAPPWRRPIAGSTSSSACAARRCWRCRPASRWKCCPTKSSAQVQAPPVNDRHSRAERERLFFEAMMRILDREDARLRRLAQRAARRRSCSCQAVPHNPRRICHDIQNPNCSSGCRGFRPAFLGVGSWRQGRQGRLERRQSRRRAARPSPTAAPKRCSRRSTRTRTASCRKRKSKARRTTRTSARSTRTTTASFAGGACRRAGALRQPRPAPALGQLGQSKKPDSSSKPAESSSKPKY